MRIEKLILFKKFINSSIYFENLEWHAKMVSKTHLHLKSLLWNEKQVLCVQNVRYL